MSHTRAEGDLPRLASCLEAPINGAAAAFEAARVLDEDLATYWAAPDASSNASLTLTLPRPTTFDRVVLQEPIELGQRVSLFEIEAATASGWQRIGTGTTVGHKRIVVVPRTTAREVRVTIHQARGPAALSRLALHALPEAQTPPPGHDAP
jgi:alpha-L-fucosidase